MDHHVASSMLLVMTRLITKLKLTHDDEPYNKTRGCRGCYDGPIDKTSKKCDTAVRLIKSDYMK